MFLVINNGKINLWKGNSQFLLTPKPSITMIIGMPGIELFSITQMLIIGFSTFMTIAQLIFLFGSIISWHGLVLCQMFYLQKPKKGGISRSKIPSPWDHTCAKCNFFVSFNIAWVFCWEYHLHQYFQDFIPLSLVRIYKIKW